MSTVQLQFHAEPQELVELTARWARAHKLDLVVERFFPVAEAVAVGRTTELTAVCAQLRRVDRVWLCTEGTVDPEETRPEEFAVGKLDRLSVLIRHRDETGVRESAIGGTTQRHSLLRTWRTLIKTAKSEMHKGAVVRNPAPGAAQRLPAHLHTLGAHTLAEQASRCSRSRAGTSTR